MAGTGEQAAERHLRGVGQCCLHYALHTTSTMPFLQLDGDGLTAAVAYAGMASNAQLQRTENE